MEMLTPSDLPDLPSAAARRLIAAARSIAPCLDSLVDEARADAVAILAGVAAELPTPGTGRVRSQSRNGTSVTWADYSSAFTADDRAALRALCSTVAVAGSPVGHFPASAVASDIWPPEEYS